MVCECDISWSYIDLPLYKKIDVLEVIAFAVFIVSRAATGLSHSSNSRKLWPDLVYAHLSYIDLSAKPLSHQWYDIRAPLYNDKFLVFVWQSYSVVPNTPTLPYYFTGSQQACSFSLPFLDARLL